MEAKIENKFRILLKIRNFREIMCKKFKKLFYEKNNFDDSFPDAGVRVICEAC